MPDRSHARYLAPLALVAFVLATIVVVSTTGGGGSSKSNSAATAAKHPAAPGTNKKFYRVKPGDLLSEISQRTGVDIGSIIKLNPNVDPQALQAGQLIRVRR
jgi:LysM repeat protein